MMTASATRVLVIDDNPEMVDILVTLLGEEGYRVQSALSSDEGLKLFIQSRPDIVLLDITLAGDMTGVDVLKRMRSIQPTARVLMVSGAADLTLAREALELGALAYIDKPFELAYLKRAVAMALQTENAVRADCQSYVMAWSGLEYLTVPQWRTAFETADVIFGVDVVTGHEILVFSRAAPPLSGPPDETDRRQILRVSIDGASDELELLTAACEAYRGHHDYKARLEH